MREVYHRPPFDKRTTIKETSVDTSKSGEGIIEYMTESELSVINFDDIKTKYVEEGNFKVSVVPKSNDALYVDESTEDVYFIEFKNGDIDALKNYNIKIKIYDSLLIFLDIIKDNIEYTRNNMHYILVYNEEKTHSSKFFSEEEYAKLNKEEINFSYSYSELAGMISDYAKEEFIQFGLDNFKGIYFKEVSTYTKWQFEKYFIGKFSKN